MGEGTDMYQLIFTTAWGQTVCPMYETYASAVLEASQLEAPDGYRIEKDGSTMFELVRHPILEEQAS